MAAVVAPIGVDHAQLRDRRIAVLGEEMSGDEDNVRLVHREAVFFDKLGGGEIAKRNRLRERRLDMGKDERIRQLHRRLAGIDGVDDVGLDLRDLFFAQPAVKHIYDSAPDGGAFDARRKADALRRGIGALVELAGKVFDRKNAGAVGIGQLAVGQIDLRLGKDGRDAFFEDAFFNALNIVAVDDAELFERGDTEKIPDVAAERFRRFRKFGALFAVNSVNHGKTFRCLFDGGKSPCADIVTIVHFFEFNVLRSFIGGGDGFL